jgi:lysophospholipase L1-like esterase
MVNPEVSVPGDGVICISKYDSDGNFIAHMTFKVTAAGTLFEPIIGSGVAAVKIRTNSRLELADVCVAEEAFETFEPYTSKIVIKPELIDPEPILKKSKPFYGKTIVNFGDSIFGNKQPPNDVSTALANVTGATVHNCGFDGCRMASHNDSWDAFSMYRLAYAIANNDYALQDAVDVPNVSGMPAYFADTRTLLKSIDWSKVDIITIAYGTNDWTAGKTLDNEVDALDTNTFCGALRYSLETIIAAYPHIKIFVCGQTYRFWMDDGGNFVEDSDTKVINDVKLTDFAESTEAVSKAYHVPFIDNYDSLGINKINRGYYFPVNDGTHHNALGAKLLAEHIAHELF